MSMDIDAAVESAETQKRFARMELMIAALVERVAHLEEQMRPARVSVKEATVNPRTAHLSATMTEHLKSAIQHDAARQQMTVSQWIEDAALARLDWE